MRETTVSRVLFETNTEIQSPSGNILDGLFYHEEVKGSDNTGKRKC